MAKGQRGFFVQAVTGQGASDAERISPPPPDLYGDGWGWRRSRRVIQKDQECRIKAAIPHRESGVGGGEHHCGVGAEHERDDKTSVNVTKEHWDGSIHYGVGDGTVCLL